MSAFLHAESSPDRLKWATLVLPHETIWRLNKRDNASRARRNAMIGDGRQSMHGARTAGTVPLAPNHRRLRCEDGGVPSQGCL
jgi:hypothetical protein